MNILKKLTLACGLLAITGAPVSTALGAKTPNPNFNVKGACLLTGIIMAGGCLGVTKFTNRANKASGKFVDKVIDKKKRPSLHKITTNAFSTSVGLTALLIIFTLKEYYGLNKAWSNNLTHLGLKNCLWKNQYLKDTPTPDQSSTTPAPDKTPAQEPAAQPDAEKSCEDNCHCDEDKE